MQDVVSRIRRGIRVCSVREEDLSNLVVPEHRDVDQRRIAELGTGVDVGARLGKKAYRLCVALHCEEVQSRLPELAAGGKEARVCVKQPPRLCRVFDSGISELTDQMS
jgi:hypothetical protein